MSLVLSGTDGLSDIDGSAATPAIRGTDTNTGIFFPAADTIAFAEGGVESMRITSAGDVGIGTSSPSGKLNISGTSTTARITGTDGTAILRYNNGTSDVAQLVIAGGNTLLDYNGAMQFRAGVNGSEVARIDSSGKVFIGTTSFTGLLNMSQTAGDWVIVENSTFAGTQYFNSFRYAGTQIGTITGNNTNTSYTTSSDYRLKENIVPMTGALAKVALLKPCTYKWKVDGSDGQGFIAHELDEVVSGCVTGEKDAVDADGNPQYQGIDTSFLVATLTAAIQEQQALITALTTRITALEAA